MLTAILSTSAETAFHGGSITAPVYSAEGDLVAANQAAMWDGSLANPIGFDENADAVRDGSSAWTGTLANGSWSQESCGDWNNASPFVFGRTGNILSVNISWTAGSSLPCNSSLRMYGISPKLTVVPQPTAFFLGVLLSTGGAGGRWLRRFLVVIGVR